MNLIVNVIVVIVLRLQAKDLRQKTPKTEVIDNINTSEGGKITLTLASTRTL